MSKRSQIVLSFAEMGGANAYSLQIRNVRSLLEVPGKLWQTDKTSQIAPKNVPHKLPLHNKIWQGFTVVIGFCI